MRGVPLGEAWGATHLQKWARGLGRGNTAGRGARKTEERGRDADERDPDARAQTTAKQQQHTEAAVSAQAGAVVLVESLILAQDQRWRRA
jgi:hypothetical protein